MKSIPHKSRTRFLAHNPSGELLRVVSHQFTTANPKERLTFSGMASKVARCLKLSKEK